MEKLFYSNKDIREKYNICKSTASEHMKRMREIYKIDESRLPKKGLLPVNVVKDYFNQGTKKDTLADQSKVSQGR